MSANKKLDIQTETQVVAMIARGDSYDMILQWLKTEKGVTIAKATLTKIKDRNTEALSFMKSELIKKETTVATTLLAKSRKLIDQRLDRALNLENEMIDLARQRDSGEIDDAEYFQRVDVLMRNRLSVSELNSISKESFNQSQVEAGKPTSITESPTQAKENLKTLLEAITNRDDAAALKAIFPDD